MKPKKEIKREDIYLIYYFPPVIKYTPLRDRRLLNILLPYIYNYRVDGKEIKGVLVFYGLPVHKKELLEFEQTSDPELLFEYKAINFYANLEDLPEFQVRSIFNKLTNPAGIDAEKLEFEYNGRIYEAPDIEINYYPLVYRAYTIYTLLKEKETVLVRSAQKISTWKELISYMFSETTRLIFTFATRYPFHFMILCIFAIIFIIILVVLGNALKMLSSLQTVHTATKLVTNATVLKP